MMYDFTSAWDFDCIYPVVSYFGYTVSIHEKDDILY